MKRILGMGSVNNNYELLTIVSYVEQQLTEKTWKVNLRESESRWGGTKKKAMGLH